MPDTPASPYDLGVFVGRFQPFHNGHLQVIRAGLEHARQVLVVIGSSGLARRPDFVPFTAEERRHMILASLTPAERERVVIGFTPDLGNLVLWSEAVQALAAEALKAMGAGPDARVTLVGHSKDRTSYYLNAFPQWAAVEVPAYGALSATQLRDAYFAADPAAVDAWLAGPARDQAPAAVIDWLASFRATPEYADMLEELRFAERYRGAWSAAPYPPVFVTADAVVIQGAHILLIQRKGRPGKGLWAIPGGFLEQDEFILDAAVRELAEETGLQVPEDVLRRSVAASRIFDAPRRDIRGRTVTHAFLFRLPAARELPVAVGADDAVTAQWVPLDQLRRETMFNDHYLIVETLTGLAGGAL